MFGTIDEAATKVYDALHGGRRNYTQAQLSLMNSALDKCKQLQGIDVNSLD
jgi:hypothetical protein